MALELTRMRWQTGWWIGVKILSGNHGSEWGVLPGAVVGGIQRIGDIRETFLGPGPRNSQ